MNAAPWLNYLIERGESFSIPKGIFSVESDLVPLRAGQIVSGSGKGATVIALSHDIDGFSYSDRSPKVRDLTISGDGSQRGIFIGPSYVPYWTVDSVDFFNLAVGVDNSSPSSEPAAYGSDAGGIFSCRFSTYGIGFRARGNKDFTTVIASSFVDGDIGIQVESGGNIVQIGGVMANNRIHHNITEGDATLNSIWWEGLKQSGTCFVDSGLQSHVDITAGVLARGGVTVPFLRAQHGRVNLGFNPDLSARVDGSADIRGAGQLVDYNGVRQYRAGDYRAMTADNPMPVPSADRVGEKFLLLAYGAVTSDRLVQCRQTAPGQFEWKEL